MKTSSLFVCLAFCITIVQMSSAQTVYVGSCRPHQVSYPTISAAVGAVAANTTVDICPGTYPEDVTITTPLNLKGLTSEPGVRTVFVQSITVQGPTAGDLSPVNIGNLAVGGNGLIGGGIVYSSGAGTVENVDVRGGRIVAKGAGVNAGSFLTVRNSSISGGGIYATGTVSAGTELNLTANWITCDGCVAVDYENGANGLIEGNTIILSGQNSEGLSLGFYFGTVTANNNTIIGASVGIGMGTSEHPITLTHNHLYNNEIGIASGQRGGGVTINDNTIVQSSVAAIGFSFCNYGLDNTYKYNTIVDAPIGIQNVSTQDVSGGNMFYDVTTPTTACAP